MATIQNVALNVPVEAGMKSHGSDQVAVIVKDNHVGADTVGKVRKHSILVLAKVDALVVDRVEDAIHHGTLSVDVSGLEIPLVGCECVATLPSKTLSIIHISVVHPVILVVVEGEFHHSHAVTEAEILKVDTELTGRCDLVVDEVLGAVGAAGGNTAHPVYNLPEVIYIVGPPV